MKRVAVILAGGIGVKLWPLSRYDRPKQFGHILGEGVLLQNTVSRLLPLFAPEDIFVLTTSQYRDITLELVPMLPPTNILTEPFGRNTAACVALTLTLFEAQFPDEDYAIAFLPADHLIPNVREFQEQLRLGFEAAEQLNAITTLGIPPTRPETAYGYIQIEANQQTVPQELHSQGIYKVATFAEKPDIDTARRFLNAGDFLWNTGIYIAPATVFQKNLQQYLPDFVFLFRLLKKHLNKADYLETLETIYRQLPSISIDYGIMEKTTDAYVVECSFNWSDLGSWDEVYRLSLKDADDNVLIGNVLALNARGCYVRSNDKLFALVDVEDLIIVDSGNAAVICRRGSSERIKEIVNALRRKKMTPFL